MGIERISTEAIKRIIKESITTQYTCVIKAYSNSCPLCHELKEDYEFISSLPQFSNVHFFVFNIEDYPGLSDLVDLNGVPSIILVNTGFEKSIHILRDPKMPHPRTWYFRTDIVNFIDNNRRKA